MAHNEGACAGERQQGTSLEAAAREAGVESHAVAGMQERLRAALAGDTGAISATRILHLYLERLGVDFKVCSRANHRYCICMLKGSPDCRCVV